MLWYTMFMGITRTDQYPTLFIVNRRPSLKSERSTHSNFIHVTAEAT